MDATSKTRVAADARQLPRAWFTPAQLARMAGAQPPRGHDPPAKAPAPQATPEREIRQAAPPLQAVDLGDGSMPYLARAASAARVSRDASRGGIRSSDRAALGSREALLQFFGQHNAQPPVHLRVRGYHTETWSTTDAHGDLAYERHDATDFAYSVDLGSFLHPLGKVVAASDTGESVVQLMDDYLASKNGLESLTMTKRLAWPTAVFEALVRAYIVDQLGWRHKLEVAVVVGDRSVRVCRDSGLAACWEDPVMRCVAVATVLPALVVRACRRERHLTSVFVVQRSPEDLLLEILPDLSGNHLDDDSHIVLSQ